MFKLAFNSTTLRYFDILEAVRIIKEYKYDAVELMLNDTHLHPTLNTSDRIREVRDYCKDNGITLACIAAGGPLVLSDVPYEPSLVSGDAASRAKRADFIKRSIDLAHFFEVPALIINSGKLPADVQPEKAHDFLLEGIENLLGHTGELILAIEPEPDFFIGTSVSGVDLVKEAGSPNLRLNLDIGHVFVSESDCYDHIEAALPCTRHINIEDIKGGVHHHEIPGEGDIDFTRVIGLIEESGYEFYVSVELHHHDQMWERALKESRDYLLRLMQGCLA